MIEIIVMVDWSTFNQNSVLIVERLGALTIVILEIRQLPYFCFPFGLCRDTAGELYI